MRNNLVFGMVAVFSFVLFACDDPNGGGSGGAATTSSSSSSSSSGTAGAGGTGGSGGMAGAGGANVGGSAGMGGGGGGQAENALCGQSANGALCAQGLVCCYPCGIPDCDWKCAQPCDPNTPGCANGCPLLP